MTDRRFRVLWNKYPDDMKIAIERLIARWAEYKRYEMAANQQIRSPMCQTPEDDVKGFQDELDHRAENVNIALNELKNLKAVYYTEQKE